MLALALTVLLAGCSSALSELRQAPPNRTATIKAERSALASCVIAGLRVGDHSVTQLGGDQLIYQTDEGATRTEIIGYANDPVRLLVPVYALTVTTTGSNVAIESRQNMGRLDRIDRQAWSSIERCAGSKVDMTPPLEQ